MKKLFVQLILLVTLPFMCFSISDTLRHYNPMADDSYALSGYELYVGRFEPEAPGYLTEIIVTLSGLSTNGTVELHVFGHEGGTSFPQLMHDLISPITVQKTMFGYERISVELPDPLWLDNNQFFIAFSDIDNGVKIISSNEAPEASCSSTSGGNYYYQFYFGSGNWYLGNKKSFKLDAIMDYPNLYSNQHFQDVTGTAGVNPALGNSTIATVDYDEDGYVDMLVTGNLYRNLGNGEFVNKTQEAGLRGNPWVNTFVDMDNDGDLDILFLDANDSSFIFVNQGNGYFAEQYISSLPVFKSIHGYSIADINHDNYPDLFVCQLWDAYPEPQLNYLFFNDTNLGFVDTTKTIYPQYNGVYNYPNAAWNPPNYVYEKNRNSRGSSWVDFDNDGDLDLFVTNYFLQQDEFYQNNGDGTFTDICVSKGIDHNPGGGSNHGTGTDWYDYDNDGDFDLLLPQFAHPAYLVAYDHRGTTIYRNEGPPSYSFFDTHGNSSDADGDQGIQFEETHAGACWGDFNNDGLADFYISTYYGCRFVDIYIQNTDHSFSLKTFDYGIENIVSGNDGVCFDFNGDGRLDLAAGDGGHIRIFKNKDPDTGNSIFVKAYATSTNKYAIGAKVKIFVNGQILTQEVNAGRGQKMQRPFTLHYGLGSNIQVDSAQVYWPGNPVPETFLGLIANNVNVLTEGGSINFIGNPIDAAIISFANATGCGFSSSELVGVQIANFGYDTITTFQIYYTLDGQAIPPQLVDTIIPPGDFINFVFDSTADFSLAGIHILSAEIICPNDSNALNDQLEYYQIYNNPQLFLGEDIYVCDGEPVLFSVQPDYDVASYLWSDGTTGENLEALAAGIYMLTVTDMCAVDISDTIELFYYPVPQVNLGNNIYLPPGDSVELDAGQWTGYLWSTGDTSQFLMIYVPGVFSVTITDQHGCQSSDEISVQYLSSNELVDLSEMINIYPNPGSGVFTISSDLIYIDKIEIDIFSVIGSKITSFRKKSFPARIDLSTFSKGVYLVRIGNSETSVIKQIVIK